MQRPYLSRNMTLILAIFYPEGASIDHDLIHSLVRISGDRAEKAMVQWQKELSGNKVFQHLNGDVAIY